MSVLHPLLQRLPSTKSQAETTNATGLRFTGPSHYILHYRNHFHVSWHISHIKCSAQAVLP